MSQQKTEKLKVSKAQKAEIRRLYEEGLSPTDIGKTLSIQGQQVAGVVQSLINFAGLKPNPNHKKNFLTAPMALLPKGPDPDGDPSAKVSLGALTNVRVLSLERLLKVFKATLDDVVSEVRHLRDEVGRLTSGENEALSRSISRHVAKIEMLEKALAEKGAPEKPRAESVQIEKEPLENALPETGASIEP